MTLTISDVTLLIVQVEDKGMLWAAFGQKSPTTGRFVKALGVQVCRVLGDCSCLQRGPLVLGQSP